MRLSNSNINMLYKHLHIFFDNFVSNFVKSKTINKKYIGVSGKLEMKHLQKKQRKTSKYSNQKQ